MRFVARHRLLVALALVVGCWQACQQAAIVVQILFATRTLGLSEQAIGLSYTGMGVGTVLASVFGNRISRPHRPRAVPDPRLRGLRRRLAAARRRAGQRLGRRRVRADADAVLDRRGVHLHQLPRAAPGGHAGAAARPHDEHDALADPDPGRPRRAARRLARRARRPARFARGRRRGRAAARRCRLAVRPDPRACASCRRPSRSTSGSAPRPTSSGRVADPPEAQPWNRPDRRARAHRHRAAGPARAARRRRRAGERSGLRLARRARALDALGRHGADASTSRKRTAGASRRRFILREDFVLLHASRAAPTAARASSSAAPACTASTGRCASSRSATGARPAAHGRGFVTEAVRAARAAGLRRRSPRAGSRSAWTTATRAAGSVAERAGFTLEALLRFDAATPARRAAQHARLRARARRRGADRARAPGASACARDSVGDAGAGREAVDRVGDDAVDAERIEPARLGRIVDGVDEAAQAGAVRCGRARPRPSPSSCVTTATQPSACASASQPARSASSSRRARQLRRGRRARRRARSGWNEVSSGGVAPRRPRARPPSAPTTRPVSRSPPGRRLDLDVEREVVAQAEAGDRREARQRLAGVGAAVPAAGVEARQLAPGQRRGGAAARGRALAASRRAAGRARRRPTA